MPALPTVMTDEAFRKLEKFCKFKPTLLECAYFLGADPNTIERAIRKRYNKTFSEYRDSFVVQTKYSLISKAVQQALDGNTKMMVFCLKNLAGWKEKHETDLINSDGTLKPPTINIMPITNKEDAIKAINSDDVEIVTIEATPNE